MRLEVDRDICVSAGMCVLTAPEIFDQDDEDGRVVLLVREPAATNEATAREAARLCPSGAIVVREETERPHQ